MTVLGSKQRLAVVAFGGNALIAPGEHGELNTQWRNAIHAVSPLVQLLRRNYDLVIVHGNGPQVGLEMLAVEEASSLIPPVTLDFCVSKTQGTMAYMLELALRNRLARTHIVKHIISLVTTVEVNAHDPAFHKPTKPVGPFFNEYQAKKLIKQMRWTMIEDAGRGWRKVVPSPRPVRVLAIDAIAKLAGEGNIVIAGGGGGIPVVVNRQGKLIGIEAVIDKDFTASLVAQAIRAELLVDLSAVDYVALNFGTPKEKNLRQVTTAEGRQYLAEGHFAAGSMEPKMRAMIEFVENTGGRAIITSLSHLLGAVRGKMGTHIVSGEREQALFA